MKYVGSKSRFAKYLIPIIQSFIDTTHYDTYIEPFVGGANVIDKIKCKNRIGYDNNPYLIALLNKIKEYPCDLPMNITKEEYNKVKSNKDKYEKWYVGYVGFLASYNAKFFDGYAGICKTKSGKTRNYFEESVKNLIKQSGLLKEIEFKFKDFKQLTNLYRSIIYCDIPYKDTYQYKNKFDYDIFYKWCDEMSSNNIVLVSEYSMPNTFVSITTYESNITLSYSRFKTPKRLERLFIHNNSMHLLTK